MRCGKGVFAKEDINKGELVIICGGAVMRASEEHGDYGIQVSEDMVLAAPPPPPEGGQAELSVADYVNHSCAPNIGFRGQIFIVTMRTITQGEELTLDYAMCLHAAPSVSRYEMKCDCGHPSCRKVVTEDDWHIPELQRRYDGYFQWYLQEKIHRMRHVIEQDTLR